MKEGQSVQLERVPLRQKAVSDWVIVPNLGGSGFRVFQCLTTKKRRRIATRVNSLLFLSAAFWLSKGWGTFSLLRQREEEKRIERERK